MKDILLVKRNRLSGMLKKPTEVYDFKAFGQAIKADRKAKGYTRERLGKELGIAHAILSQSRT